RQDKKIKKELIKKNSQKPNKGHHFEYLMFKALQESGHIVTELENLRISKANIDETDSSIISLLKKFIKRNIKEKSTFHTVNDLENRNSLSSDFINETMGLSCKKDNCAIKHPKIGSIWSLISNTNLWEEIFVDYKSITGNRESFLEQINLN